MTAATSVDRSDDVESNGSVRAVLVRVRAALRTGWRSVIIVAAIVAVVSATVLALAAGARRTATAPDRYTAAAGGDVGGLVLQPSGRPRLDEIASLPAVEHVDGITFVGAWFDGGRETNPFAGGLTPGGRLVSGRAASPGPRAGEFVANLAFVEAYNATVGQTYEIGVWTQPQVDRNALDEPPEGQSFEATLVGIVDSPAELDDPTPSTYFSPALLESDIGVVTTLMAVQLVPGATRDDLRAQLDSLPDGSELALEPLPIVSVSVRNAVTAQAQGLWVITLVAAFAALAAMGQVLSRHARVSELDRRRLVALGASRTQLLGEALGRAVVPAVGGVLGGALVATLASGWFPAGFVRRVEPAQASGPMSLSWSWAWLSWWWRCSPGSRWPRGSRSGPGQRSGPRRSSSSWPHERRPLPPRPGCASPLSGAIGRAVRWRARSSVSSSRSQAWSPPPGSP